MTKATCHTGAAVPGKGKPCPQCNGSKMIKGTCSCDMEWRGNRVEEEWQDCQCTPEVVCPVCNGTGMVDG
ncbi:MAG: ankyrin [Thermodesulfobacteriota bacterium]